MSNHDFSGRIAGELNLTVHHVANVLKLFAEGATVPFIARYRKEMTGSMDEESVIRIRDLNERYQELEKRREVVLKSLEGQGVLTEALRQSVLGCNTLADLEDVYLPYRPKRVTRAEIARGRGLLPLAKTLMEQGLIPLQAEAAKYVNAERGVATVEEALAGARDIIAAWINENKVCRAKIRRLFETESRIFSAVVKGKEQEGDKYRDYFRWDELLHKAPSHRLLAMFRGEQEGFLKLVIAPPEEAAKRILEGVVVKNDFDAGQQVALAAADSYKRLIAPSMETEMRAAARERADAYAIRVFADNVRQLLMAPPLGQKRVLAIDPGFRTGCKVVCLDAQGNLLHNTTIYPHLPQREHALAAAKIKALVSQYKIEAIAVGNGTAGRETESLVRGIRFDREVVLIMVNESGASVYSASKVARAEFPTYDITVRGAVSIGRRLQDPLAELVKIEPKSIGVGQYQHDVNQKLLERSLEDTVVSCVNQVGVDVNTASMQLLTYVSGVGPVLAGNIVEHRKKIGTFSSREQLKEVPRLGPKAFEQAAGFLRIRSGANPLDNTAVHPEAYPVVLRMAQQSGLDPAGLIADRDARKSIVAESFVNTRFGLPTIIDILKELDKPGRDPRMHFELVEFNPDVKTIHDLKPGMVLTGIVTNIAAFGAFVDIGVHQDGLIHISQVADEFVSDIGKYLHLHQKVTVKVLQVEPERKRIQLTLKA
ncbi:MAG TPA: Tex family protein [Bacteroidales bacterium]|nr:Tex family protein [Bacteroidales bacterium]HRZ49467.1 Tex family protein [Bacteroidales bacterium]